jgi:hypothetical protein
VNSNGVSPVLRTPSTCFSTPLASSDTCGGCSTAGGPLTVCPCCCCTIEGHTLALPRCISSQPIVPALPTCLQGQLKVVGPLRQRLSAGGQGQSAAVVCQLAHPPLHVTCKAMLGLQGDGMQQR